MSDLSGYLPFSQRPRRDESKVSRDWRPLTGQTLANIVHLLEALEPESWHAPTLRADWTVRDVAGHLAWRLTVGRRELLRDRVVSAAGGDLSADLLDGRRSREAASQSIPTLLSTLRALADARLALVGRGGVRDLGDVVVCAFDLSKSLDRAVEVPPIASGAVALARQLIAPPGITAVLRGRTLIAMDAEWSVGRGPELLGSAQSIVLFLFGRAGLPPG